MIFSGYKIWRVISDSKPLKKVHKNEKEGLKQNSRLVVPALPENFLDPDWIRNLVGEGAICSLTNLPEDSKCTLSLKTTLLGYTYSQVRN